MKKSITKTFLDGLTRNKIDHLEEYGVLLQMAPYPSLIVDRQEREILAVNSSFIELTAFSQKEILNQSLSQLISDIPSQELNPGDEFSGTVARKNRPAVTLKLRTFPLDQSNEWLILTTGVITDTSDVSDKGRKSFLALGDILAELETETDITPLVQRMTESINQLLQVDYVAVYLKNAQSVFEKVYSIEPQVFFPAEVASSDLSLQKKILTWQHGERAQNELHRQAQVNGLQYLGSYLLEDGQNPLGLLMVGSMQPNAVENIDPLIQSFGKILGKIISQSYKNNQTTKNHNDLQAALAQFQGGLEQSQENVVILDPDLKVVWINQMAEWTLGYTNSEVAGVPVSNLLIGADRLMPALDYALQGTSSHDLGDSNLHRRDGQPFAAKIKVAPILKDGVVQSIAVYFSDISEHERIQQHSQQLEHRALLGDITAVFAHEVRNPINNISLNSQLLISKFAPDEPNRELVNRILNECARLKQLMESILNFSRPKERKPEPLDLAKFLQQIIDRWRPRFLKANVEAFFSSDPELPKIMGDPHELDQVFTNLIGNAVDAMSVHGSGALAIRIVKLPHVYSGRSEIEISISDNGPGIPEEQREQIFKPFKSNKPDGTGLGLAITKQIVQAHRGNIVVESFPGGTVFKITLPVFAEGE
ncbi:MAG TPA: ATP-binding protein [Longilinea sp.]|nr:ATP-binding protein [Longilinea sp.]